MDKVLTIVKREYKLAVYKKSFIIITLLAPLLMIGLGTIPTILTMMDTGKAVTIDVADSSNVIYEKLSSTLNDTLKNGKKRFVFNNVGASSNTEQLKAKILAEKVDGLITIPQNFINDGSFSYYAKNVADIGFTKRVERTLYNIVKDIRISENNIPTELISKITKPVSITTIKVLEGAKEAKKGFMQEYLATLIFVLILYMSMIMYGATIGRSIIEEKTGRIIEVLLSSASPFQLMTGKILGLGAVGLTQVIVWAAMGIGFVVFGSTFNLEAAKSMNLNPEIFIYFAIFYILGYFVFATMYAGVGAVSNSDQELQQLSMPIIFMLIIPILLIGMMVKNPDGPVITALSYIPFFSPIVMFTRINLAAPPMLNIIFSILIIIATIFILIWIVSKIYRVGILMYGKRPTLPEMIKWIRLN
jgi:ABC-2 type transport system permease protein